MSLCKALKDFNGFQSSASLLPEISRTELVLKGMPADPLADIPVTKDRVEEVVSAIFPLQTREEFFLLPIKILKYARNCAFEPDIVKRLGTERVFWLADRLTDPYSSSITDLRSVYRQYKKIFTAGEALTQYLSEKLQAREHVLPERIKNEISEYDMLNSDGLGGRIAVRLQNADNYVEFLKQNGIPEARRPLGVSYSAFIALLDIYSSSETPFDQHALEKLIHWVTADQGKPLFADSNSLLFQTLMSPWTTTETSGAIPEKTTVQRTIADLFGEPYPPRHVRWNIFEGEAPGAYKEYMRWLTEGSIELFFGIIDETAELKHWNTRKDFWRAYFDAGYIDEAFAVLGRYPTHAAKQKLHTTKEPGYGFHGHMNFSDASHGVLILKMRGLVVVEGSHNMATRFFSQRGKPPKLYKTTQKYLRKELWENVDKKLNHVAPASNPLLWCSKHSEIICKLSNNRVPDLWPDIRLKVTAARKNNG